MFTRKLVSRCLFGSLLGLVVIAESPALASEPKSSPSCELSVRRAEGTNPRVDVRVGDRHIAVLGWDHLSPFQVDVDKRDRLFEAALSAVDFKDCDQAQHHLDKLLTLLAKDVSRGTQLWKDLNDVEDEFPLDAIGLELTPQELLTFMVQTPYKADGFNAMLKKCPLNTRSRANILRFAMPGPVYLFQNQRTKKLRLEGIEDATVKSHAIALAQQIDLLMPLHSETLPDSAQAKFDEFQNKISRGGNLTDADVADFIQNFGASPVGAKVGQFLGLLKRLLAMAPARNEAIARKALAGTGNYAITLGRSHVTDVAQRILDQCQARNAAVGSK